MCGVEYWRNLPVPEGIALSSETTYRLVLLGGKQFYHYRRTMLDADGKAKEEEAIEAFDGKRSVRYSILQARATIRDEKSLVARWLPHLLWRPFGWHARELLATFIAGTQVSAVTQMALVHGGQERIDDLTCVKLVGKLSIAKKSAGHFHVWLAVDRNYLPIRFEHFAEGNDKSPRSTFQVTKLEKLADGAWLPRRAHLKAFDRESLSGGGVPLLEMERTYEYTKAQLAPRYEAAFFQIALPKGTMVTEHKKGKIVRKYKQGEDDGKEP